MFEEQPRNISAPSSHDILNDLLVAVIVCTEQEIVYYNQSFKDFTAIGGKQVPLSLEDLYKSVVPEDLALVETFRKKVFSDGQFPDKIEFRIQPSSAEIKWCKLSLNKLDGEQGQEKQATLILEDITREKTATGEQAWTDNLFKTVFRISQDFMILSRLPATDIVSVNPTFLNLFGLRRDQVIGKATHELGVWAEPMLVQRFIEELKMSSFISDVPASVRVRGGVMRHINLSAQKLEQGGDEYLLLIGRDITDELTQAQELKRSRDSADLANRAKSEFLANMSHELRTPLNAILGFAEILRDEIFGPIGSDRYKDYASDIYNSGSHLLEIINDILDLSKVEAGRMDTQIRWIEPQEAIESCLSFIHQRALQGGLVLTSDIDEDMELEADERLFKQICLNLMSNAVKFTEPGGEVSVRLKPSASGGAILCVQDTGIGMTPEELKIAKRPFGQIDNALSRSQEGSGLGLPLVSSFAERLKATFVIDSTPGQGTRVSIMFPPDKVRAPQGSTNESDEI
ncbi:hypothetical protein GCM10017044_14820 [Kordiimonas sediminis]|uniref:histidine kinase n=1 Tax=Kordiimonas sediminis TaxID=1735581 RepID=A0A919AT51_9PROT|nr:PAS domain-containing sensor histidine kinase [Kordiimonas sediminis]GHF20938.1 hypothetical protein GCM10017044_14820 [Kordiimonas sediminis]